MEAYVQSPYKSLQMLRQELESVIDVGKTPASIRAAVQAFLCASPAHLPEAAEQVLEAIAQEHALFWVVYGRSSSVEQLRLLAAQPAWQPWVGGILRRPAMSPSREEFNAKVDALLAEMRQYGEPT